MVETCNFMKNLIPATKLYWIPARCISAVCSANLQNSGVGYNLIMYQNTILRVFNTLAMFSYTVWSFEIPGSYKLAHVCKYMLKGPNSEDASIIAREISKNFFIIFSELTIVLFGSSSFLTVRQRSNGFTM